MTPRRGAWFALVALPATLFAQSPCAKAPDNSKSGSLAAPGSLPPLDRHITAHFRDISLRDALERAAAAGSIRLSYSADILPLDRRVCVWRDSASLGEVLSDLLNDLSVRPVIVAGDQVVLTPSPAGEADTPPSVAVLDRVVVTGSMVARAERALAVAIDVVPGQEINRRDDRTLSQIMDASVPGLWLWEQSPSSMLARYGSIRGASSFGMSYPKIYVDGIEVANPLLLTQITPELVDRVEVIRGPQGSALYGSDAISGVVNIVSRHEGRAADGTRLMLRSEGGMSATAYTASPVVMQNHDVSFRVGDALKSGGLMAAVSTFGDYVPNGYSRELHATADGRFIGNTTTLSLVARFHGKEAGVARNPLLRGSVAPSVAGDSLPQSLQLYSVGSTLEWHPSDDVTHSFTAGVDGYRLDNVSNDLAAIPSSADSALRAASGLADRATLRGGTLIRIGDNEDRLATTISFAAEQSVLRDETLGDLPPVPSGSAPGPGGSISTVRVEGWSHNTGVSTQADFALNNTAFLTAGVRVERMSQPRGALTLFETMPMLGGALVRDFNGTTFKLRSAYGRGIRPPNTSLRQPGRETKRSLANALLSAESQSGIEGGADVFVGNELSLHLTRFDQHVSGLIQIVSLYDSVRTKSGTYEHAIFYQPQNVGEISNRGWEAEAAFNVSRLVLKGAATFTSSTVERVLDSTKYNGDLRPGDRVLAVPARTLSATADWHGSAYNLALTLTRASDWLNYDRLAIADTLANRGLSPAVLSELSGSKLRRFWKHYDGATRLRTSLSFPVYAGWTATVTGENLTNEQRGEPDSITIVPGRAILLGLKTRF